MDAERAPHRNLMRPDELKDRVSYQLHAALPSAYVNVVCANAKKPELLGLVYESQPGVVLNRSRDWADPTNLWSSWGFDWAAFDKIQTPLDDVFNWNNSTRPRPVFYKFPHERNTILNNTKPATGTDTFYLLGNIESQSVSDEFFLCSIRSGLTPVCSTRYSVAKGGKSLQPHCEDDRDEWQYARRNQSRGWTTSPEWYDVGTSLAHEVQLGSGENEGNAASSQYITELALTVPGLSNELPSPAEALAALMAPSVWASAKDSPVVEYWVCFLEHANPQQLTI